MPRRESFRILQALSGGQLGGTELMVARLVPGLIDAGIECDVSVLDAGGPVLDGFMAEAISVHDMSRHRGYAGAVRDFHRLFVDRAYDVVHLYGFRMSLVGRVAAMPLRPRPVLIHGIRGLHVTEAPDTESLKARAAIALERLGSRWIDAYASNSYGARDFLVSRGLPRERFHVVPSGLDADWWQPQGAVRRSRSVITVGNFRPVKRLVDLIDALGQLERDGVEFDATVIGDGPLRPELEQRATKQGLSGRLKMPGQLPPERIRDALDRSAVFVLPSRWEGMPASVMEAMAMSLPVIGPDVPGIRELVVHGETGWLVPSGDVAALALAIADLLDDEALGRRLGEAGRLRLRDHFSLASMASRHLDLYRSLTACRKH